ncbi:DUF5362 family protein [Draconibacterium sp. IB214405]|uniref:DUF5362 family protein n=1 Tax=Draconibacterium sp. IB214405 TaxID=3097352 RepID=UPI002A13B118|nr:DUF5362 family protein [Draconibacterium sp. IB214405]MDX8340223.1 DUF5362 family protein [Draconibacterium sp. IB214405]
MNTENTFNEETLPTENQPQVKPETLELTEEINRNLHSAGKWSQFLAILGFISTGFMILAGITMSIVTAFIPSEADIFPFPMFLVGFIYIIFAGIYFLPIFYLFRFSNSIKQAIALKKQDQLSTAFNNLRAHYKTFGIIVIVFMCLYPVIIIGFVLFGLFSGFGSALEGIPM